MWYFFFLPTHSNIEIYKNQIIIIVINCKQIDKEK